jgi:hypothetical protein
MPATKNELISAMHHIADALQWMRGPTGEIIYLGEKIPHIAFHLARAGGLIVPERAIIKRRAIPNRPGQFAGMCDWVPIDTPDRPRQPGVELISAADDLNLDALDDAIPWHSTTKIEGNFT